MSNHKGFTLIELLVVISIVALLSSVVLASLNAARGKARLAAGKQFSSHVERVAGDQAVLILDFDECSGAVAADRSGNGWNASLLGSTAWSSDTPRGTGCSASFNGNTSTYTTLASASSASYTTGQPFTVSAWVKQSAIQNRAGIVATAHYQNGGYMLAEGASVAGKPFFELNGAGTYCGAEGLSDMPTGEWVSYVGIYDGSTMYLYQNGVLIARSSCGALTANTYPLLVGKTNQGGWGAYSGLVDEVRVYSKALTALEVRDRYVAERERVVASND